MSRRPLTRAFAAIFALWLAIVLAEPAALFVCPAHDAVMSGDAAGAHAVSQATDADAASTHAHHGSDDGAPESHQCACIGHCAGASPSSLPAASADVPAPAWVVASAPLYADVSFEPVRVDHVLPFANGPPALS